MNLSYNNVLSYKALHCIWGLFYTNLPPGYADSRENICLASSLNISQLLEKKKRCTNTGKKQNLL